MINYLYLEYKNKSDYSILRRQTTQSKHGPKILTDTSVKKTQHGKSAQENMFSIINHSGNSS